MSSRRKSADASGAAKDIARLSGLGALVGDRAGRFAKGVAAPPPITPCVYGSLADIPPPEPRREGEPPEQRRAALEARTRLAMAAGVDPVAIARAAAPLPARTLPDPTRHWPDYDVVVERKAAFEATRETCFPAHTFTPYTATHPTHCGVSRVPFFEYVVEWLAATGHLVVFFGPNTIIVYPTTASPPHVYGLGGAPFHGGANAQAVPRAWSTEVGWAVGGVELLYSDHENGVFPKRGSTFSANFGHDNGESPPPGAQLVATAMTRDQLRLSSPYFRAAYQRFVERTTARNSRNFVNHHGHGDVMLIITFHVDMCQKGKSYSEENYHMYSDRSTQFVLTDPLAHVEAMGRSGVASPRDVRDLIRAWRATEVLGEPPKEPRLPNGDVVPLDEEAYAAENEAFLRAWKAWRATPAEVAAHPDAARFDHERREWLRKEIAFATEEEERECHERAADCGPKTQTTTPRRRRRRGRGRGAGGQPRVL